MSLIKRQKGKNFSDNEISLLIDVVSKFIVIVENKKTDGSTVKDKNDCWQRIADEFNASALEASRSAGQLKTYYDNFKRKTRKQNADDKAEFYKTGGGSFTKNLGPCGERLISMLKEQFRPDDNAFDSISQYHTMEPAPIDIKETIHDANDKMSVAIENPVDCIDNQTDNQAVICTDTPVDIIEG
ncbi:hypothetical protein RN001_001361 [Aquatica leii]|uniref:Regulatory protein zeste n=1 Tax=Aquatica leii TaxID=1421715 RepID=A0AAN7SSM2_9COLE|nr:hypothetical protein RN001_001361 [Aquatica leii]